MQREPRNLRGLVQTKDLADFLGASESTVRVWRKRHLDWVGRDRPDSDAIYVLFPDSVPDPQDPSEAFLVNAGPVYDVADVVRFGAYLRKHQRKAGNPQWIRSAGEVEVG